MDKKQLVVEFLEKGYLVSPDFFNEECYVVLDVLKKNLPKKGPIVLNKDLVKSLVGNLSLVEINWNEFESSKVLLEKGKEKKMYGSFLDILEYNTDTRKKYKLDKIIHQVKKQETETNIEEEIDDEANVVVLKSYNQKPKKRDLSDFVGYFRNRYETLKRFLVNRPEMEKVTSIRRLSNLNSRETVAIIGLVFDKRITKNGNLLFTIEDPSGRVNVLINKDRNELFEVGKDIVLDEVIGVNGGVSNGFMFANQILFPDIVNSDNKNAKDDVYAAFISDIHVGSSRFLKDEFEKFINWLNGKEGSKEQKELAGKVKYLFLAGDLIAGVGIYPGQENDLVYKDVVKQYQVLGDFLARIRDDVKLIIAPGNHDAVRLAEPQPILLKEFTETISNLKNVVLVSSPALVNIHAKKDFEGFNVLMYHGTSFHYYSGNVDGLRKVDAKNNPALIWKYLLKRRHLAPAHGSNVYVPETENDLMIIDKVPDIVVSGEVHKSDYGVYNGITIICGSCWEDFSEYAAKFGVVPDFCRVPLFSLKTREVKILNFKD
jgi:DNA polymerase II small subunit